jgi:hypothetical protein
MSENGQVLRGGAESWEHTHTCYTCNQVFACMWAYCREQAKRNCPVCRTALRAPQED